NHTPILNAGFGAFTRGVHGGFFVDDLTMESVFVVRRQGRWSDQRRARRIRFVIREQHVSARIRVQVERTNVVLESEVLQNVRSAVARDQGVKPRARGTRAYSRFSVARISPRPGVAKPEL